jgi:hypothetical protein
MDLAELAKRPARPGPPSCAMQDGVPRATATVAHAQRAPRAKGGKKSKREASGGHKHGKKNALWLRGSVFGCGARQRRSDAAELLTQANEIVGPPASGFRSLLTLPMLALLPPLLP